MVLPIHVGAQFTVFSSDKHFYDAYVELRKRPIGALYIRISYKVFAMLDQY